MSDSGHGQLATIDTAGAEGAPVRTVMHFEPTTPIDSGFLLLSAEAPLVRTVDTLISVCLSCLIDDHPEAGRGMDLARRAGRADHDGGEWIPGTL